MNYKGWYIGSDFLGIICKRHGVNSYFRVHTLNQAIYAIDHNSFTAYPV